MVERLKARLALVMSLGIGAELRAKRDAAHLEVDGHIFSICNVVEDRKQLLPVLALADIHDNNGGVLCCRGRAR